MAVNDPIGCGDVAVFPGDVMVGDAEGVVVIPAHLAEEIALEAVAMTAFEDFVTEKVLEGESILGLYPATDPSTETKFNQWRERSEEHTSELQSLMRISYAVLCLKQKTKKQDNS